MDQNRVELTKVVGARVKQIRVEQYSVEINWSIRVEQTKVPGWTKLGWTQLGRNLVGVLRAEQNELPEWSKYEWSKLGWNSVGVLRVIVKQVSCSNLFMG